MRRVCFALIVTFLLLACATAQKYDEKLDMFLGHNQEYLLKKWGKPSAIRQVSPQNGFELWLYVKANDTYVPSELHTYGQFTPNGGEYEPFMSELDFSPYAAVFGYQVEYYCQTAFLLENGQIIGWRWRGNNCTAY